MPDDRLRATTDYEVYGYLGEPFLTVRRLALYASGLLFLGAALEAWGWFGTGGLEDVLGLIAAGLLLLIVSMLP